MCNRRYGVGMMALVSNLSVTSRLDSMYRLFQPIDGTLSITFLLGLNLKNHSMSSLTFLRPVLEVHILPFVTMMFCANLTYTVN